MYHLYTVGSWLVSCSCLLCKCHSTHSPILFAELTASDNKGPRKHWFTALQRVATVRSQQFEWNLTLCFPLSSKCEDTLPQWIPVPCWAAGGGVCATGTLLHGSWHWVVLVSKRLSLVCLHVCETEAGAFRRSLKMKLLRIFAWSKGCFPCLRQAPTCSHKEEETQFTPQVFLGDLFFQVSPLLWVVDGARGPALWALKLRWLLRCLFTFPSCSTEINLMFLAFPL